MRVLTGPERVCSNFLGLSKNVFSMISEKVKFEAFAWNDDCDDKCVSFQDVEIKQFPRSVTDKDYVNTVYDGRKPAQ